MATITSAASGNSNTGATWVGGVVPGPNDDVVIAGHTITLNADHTWNSLLISATTSRINPDAGPRILNITTFWGHSANSTASVCIPPANCNFTINIGFFDHTANQSQYMFGLTNTNVTLNINSNNVTSEDGNIFDPIGVSTTLFIHCTQATNSINIIGAAYTVSGAVTFINMTGGALIWTWNGISMLGNAATSKALITGGTGIISATLNGNLENIGAVSTTGVIVCSNANATVTLNGNYYQSQAGGLGALINVTAGILILNGKASHIVGTNTLTISILGATAQFRWNNQSREIMLSEVVTIYATSGLIDLTNLQLTNNSRISGVLTGTVLHSSTNFTIINNHGANACINFVELTVINTPNPAPILPPQEKVEAGENYGYTASPMTGIGLILNPTTLTTAIENSIIKSNLVQIEGDDEWVNRLNTALEEGMLTDSAFTRLFAIPTATQNANAVWSSTTRTLTTVSDSPGLVQVQDDLDSLQNKINIIFENTQV